jgi:hypothetical protein
MSRNACARSERAATAGGKEVKLTHVSVRLTYAFTFERRAGRAQIVSRRLPGAQGPATASGDAAR